MSNSSRYKYVIAVTVILVRMCIGLIWASAGPLIPFIIEDYGISRGTAGWFASIAPITIAVISMPVGIISARFSLKTTFLVGAFFQAAGILAPLCPGYIPILVTRMLFAVGTAITVPVSTAIAAEWFTNEKLPLINSLTMTLVNLGNATAFAVTVPLATVFSWRTPIAAYGAFALTCAVAWLIFGRNREKEIVKSDFPPVPTPRVDFRKIISQKSTLLLSLAVLGSWGLWNSIFAWFPNYYNEVFGFALAKASSMVMMFAVGGTVGCLVGGAVSVRIGRRKPMLIISGAVMGLAALCAVFFNNVSVIYLSIVVMGMIGNLQNPSLFTIPMELPGSSLRSGVLVISVMQTFGNLGNFISPLVVGYLADMTGSYIPGFVLFAILSTGSLVAGLLLPETGPGVKKIIR